jgi:lysozyme
MRRGTLLAGIALLLALVSLAPVASAAAQSGQTFHIVGPGEYLAQIARYYGVTPQAIATANGLANANLIYPGQRLFIPNPFPATSPAPAPTAPTTGTYYTVRYGDTLGRIARYFGTTVQALAQANRLYNVNHIFAGQVLYIPPHQPTRIATYVVMRGDFLAAIAARFGTSVAAIVSYNRLTNPSLIYAGQVLYIPY